MGERVVMLRGDAFGDWLPWVLGAVSFVGGILVLAFLLVGWLRHRQLLRGLHLLEGSVRETGETLSRMRGELEQAKEGLSAMEGRWTEAEAGQAALRNAVGELQGQVGRLEEKFTRSCREWAETGSKIDSLQSQWEQERQVLRKSWEEQLGRVVDLEARFSSSEESGRALAAQLGGQASRLGEMESRLRGGEARAREMELRLAVRGDGEAKGELDDWPPRVDRDADEPADRWPVWEEGQLRSPKGF